MIEEHNFSTKFKQDTMPTSTTSSTVAQETIIQSRRSLYVGGLADELKEETLRAAMIPFGPIKSIEIPMDYAKGSHKGFAFVEYLDADDAAEALYNMDGGELMGRVLNINLAQQNQIKLGSHKAVWSTDDWFKEQAGTAGEEEREAEKARIEKDITALSEQ